MSRFMFDMVVYYAPYLFEGIMYIIFSVLAIAAAKYIKPLLQNKTIEVIAKNVVLCVEQTFKDLHGEEKLDKALERFSEMLAARKIDLPADEMKVMIEAAVAKLNNVFVANSDADKITE